MNYEQAWKLYKLGASNTIIATRGENAVLNFVLEEMNRIERVLTHRELDASSFNIIEAELSISEEVAKSLYSK